MPDASDSFRVASAVALLRVLPPMPPDDGQVQYTAALGHQQRQQPVGEVVEVGGLCKCSLDGGTAHHDQTVDVAGAVRVLPAAVGQTSNRDIAARFIHQCLVGVGHHGSWAGIQRIRQLREGACFVQIVGIDERHQWQAARSKTSGTRFANAARNTRHDVQLDRCALKVGDAGLTPFGRLVQCEQVDIDAWFCSWFCRFHQMPPQYCPQRRP